MCIRDRLHVVRRGHLVERLLGIEMSLDQRDAGERIVLCPHLLVEQFDLRFEGLRRDRTAAPLRDRDRQEIRLDRLGLATPSSERDLVLLRHGHRYGSLLPRSFLCCHGRERSGQRFYAPTMDVAWESVRQRPVPSTAVSYTHLRAHETVLDL